MPIKAQIKTHLSDLKKNFNQIKFSYRLEARNIVQCEIGNIFDEAQKFLELKFNSAAKDKFKVLDLEAFWDKYLFV